MVGGFGDDAFRPSKALIPTLYRCLLIVMLIGKNSKLPLLFQSPPYPDHRVVLK